MFIFINLAIQHGFLSFRGAFITYAWIPLIAAVIAMWLWPAEAVEAKYADLNDQDALDEALCGDTVHPLDESEVHGFSMVQQLKTAEFGLLTYTIMTYILVINFFIGSVNLQMSAVDAAVSDSTTAAFAVALPIGGIIFIPLIGGIIDFIGPLPTYSVLWLVYLAFQAFMLLYTVTQNAIVAYLSFALFALVRPMFYSLSASSVGAVFGFRNFGKIFGLINTLAGFSNLIARPLNRVAEVHGYTFTNMVVLCMQLPTIFTPMYFMFYRHRNGAATNKARRNTRKYSTGLLLQKVNSMSSKLVATPK